MKQSLTFYQVMVGYILSIESRHLSPHTIKDYKNTFKKFLSFIGKDTPFKDITNKHIEGFLATFTTVTNNTLLHYYSALAAMWSWAVREDIVSRNIVHGLTPPKPEQKEVLPFTEMEFKALLSVVARPKRMTAPANANLTTRPSIQNAHVPCC
jgi:site-specific recombinase XerD